MVNIKLFVMFMVLDSGKKCYALFKFRAKHTCMLLFILFFFLFMNAKTFLHIYIGILSRNNLCTFYIYIQFEYFSVLHVWLFLCCMVSPIADLFFPCCYNNAILFCSLCCFFPFHHPVQTGFCLSSVQKEPV